MRGSWRQVIAALLVLGSGACVGGTAAGPDAGSAVDTWPDLRCGAGLAPRRGRCAPVLDDCEGDEVPVPGGGCKRVGARECDGGIAGPPDWKCKHVGPPAACLTGWQRVAGGWCEPILPATGCAEGTMEVIGKTTCQPIGDCGSGTWGKIKLTASTVFVDRSYGGAGPDGSQAKPFTTIAAAIKAARASGGTIAVAAGVYRENLTIDGSLTLEGRCAQLVTIRGVDPKADTIEVDGTSAPAKPAVALRGITLTGSGGGISISSAAVTLERIAATGCGDAGISAKDSVLAVRDSLSARNITSGIEMDGTVATLERVVVRGTLPSPIWQSYAVGLWISASATHPSQATSLTVKDSVVADNKFYGIDQRGGTVTVERTIIRGTRPAPSVDRWGLGIFSGAPPNAKAPWTKLVVRDSVVADNHCSGITFQQADATVERSVVRDTRLDGTDLGTGILVVSLSAARRSSLVLRDSLVYRNDSFGVYLMGATGTIERTIVEQTRGKSGAGSGFPVLGIGVSATSYEEGIPSTLHLEDSAVRGNSYSGVYLSSTTATIERTVVRDSRSIENTAGYEAGSGLIALASVLTLKDAAFSGNRRSGLYLAGGSTTIARTLVRDTRPNSGDQIGGLGIYAVPSSSSDPLSLVLRETRVDGAHGTGLGLYGVKSVTIERCLIRNTKKGKLPTNLGLKEGWGDGITFASFPASSGLAGTLKLEHTLVEDSARVGMVLEGGKGYVRRSIFRGGALPIALEGGSKVAIGKLNWYADNNEDAVGISRGIEPAPPPTPPDK